MHYSSSCLSFNHFVWGLISFQISVSIWTSKVLCAGTSGSAVCTYLSLPNLINTRHRQKLTSVPTTYSQDIGSMQVDDSSHSLLYLF
jgi:hypothetical protein